MKTSFDIEHYTLSRPEEVKEFAAFHARYTHTSEVLTTHRGSRDLLPYQLHRNDDTYTLVKYWQHTEDPVTCYRIDYTETTRYDSFCRLLSVSI